MTDRTDHSEANRPFGWEGNPCRWETFNAALTGILANPAFFGPIYQGEPGAAVRFAEQVVSALIAQESRAAIQAATGGSDGR